jgi:glycosyltransferase involved in cell wall biosynthesis
MNEFSLLLSVYKNERVEYFNECMESIWHKQVVRPDEIVLVQDGPLSNELDAAIILWGEILSGTLKTIPLKYNRGLGDALKIGLDHCSNEIVARMDTDDISRPDRFKIQIQYMQEHPDCDIVGSMVTEFDDNPNIIVSSRSVPITHEEIVKNSQIKCPFNHPTVMYRKLAVMQVGNYKKFHGFEDYYLWVRMIMDGSRCFNIDKPLVNMRAGYAMLSRRGGIGYAINEIKLQYKFLEIGFISKFIFMKNILIRTPVRLLPNVARSFMYKIVRKQSK